MQMNLYHCFFFQLLADRDKEHLLQYLYMIKKGSASELCFIVGLLFLSSKYEK